LNPVRATARFGDTAAFFAEAPILMAEVDYGQKTIRIRLRDRRQGQTFEGAPKLEDGGGFTAPTERLAPPETGDDIILDPNARTYRVRWWAIPA
jgi:hypothetical protein